MKNDYNGWKNRQTWNVAMWINNDEYLYRTAVEYVQERKAKGHKPTYSGFIKYAGLANVRTGDNISFSGTRLDRNALTEMLEEME